MFGLFGNNFVAILSARVATNVNCKQIVSLHCVLVKRIRNNTRVFQFVEVTRHCPPNKIKGSFISKLNLNTSGYFFIGYLLA